jgi:maleate cis-trans isomerase
VTDRPPHLGFLYPGHAAEDDYPRLAAQLRAQPVVDLVHTSVGEDAHRVDALLDLGGPERLAEGASRFAGPVDAVVWACTSGSFVFGWDGARDQADRLGELLGVPASSTSFAFVEAARAVGVRRVALAATYPPDVVDAFRAFLAQAGIDVVAAGAEDIITATEVGTLGRTRVIELVTAGDHPDAQAVLVPDTALHSVAWVAELEAALGKPVLTANQVTMWEALRLAGVPPLQAGAATAGSLFRSAA